MARFCFKPIQVPDTAGVSLEFGFARAPGVFVVEVTEAIEHEHIAAGDLLFFRRPKRMKNGSLVLASVRGDHLKLYRLSTTEKTMSLELLGVKGIAVCENATEVQIEGTLIGMLRSY